MGSLRAAVSASGESADLSDSGMTNLFVLGSSIAPSANLELALGDWGSISIMRESTTQSAGFVSAWQGSVTGLVVHLDADHLGFPRGSTIVIGHADASGHAPQSTGTTTSSNATTTSSPATSQGGGTKPTSEPRTATTAQPPPAPEASKR